MTRATETKGFRFHDLRHAFATLTLKNGTSVNEVSQLLGQFVTCHHALYVCACNRGCCARRSQHAGQQFDPMTNRDGWRVSKW